MRFRDRRDAGDQLASALAELRICGSGVVVAIPRGGVIVADEIARRCGWPLDFTVPRKLRAPGNPELAFGAVAGDGTVYLDARLARALRVDDAYLRGEIAAQIAEIARQEERYRGGRAPFDARGRTAILVDDGLATGATAIAAVRVLRHGLAQEVVVAVPVGPPDALRRIEQEADRVICVLHPTEFTAVGGFYEDFTQTTDDEVTACLARAWERKVL
ncbi:MAG TPA: phosphoribosyltransferase family protein [bacterium]|nr:phosphoribosyltransferase family protein [bacterium]